MFLFLVLVLHVFLVIRHGVSMIVRHPIIDVIALYKGATSFYQIQIWFYEFSFKVIGAITNLSVFFVSEAKSVFSHFHES